MDAYHQVLEKLYEVTEGRDTKAVDFKEVVKSVGFYSNYLDIFDRLSRDGWIAEDEKADYVRITHWGVKEVKNPSELPNLAHRSLFADVKKAAADVKELNLHFEIFVRDVSAENLADIEKRVDDLKTLLDKIKANMD